MDTIDLLVLTCLLVCIACSLYTLGVVWRLLVEIWYAFCHVANTIDRAVIHAVDTWRHKSEAKREAPKVPDPLPGPYFDRVYAVGDPIELRCNGEWEPATVDVVGPRRLWLRLCSGSTTVVDADEFGTLWRKPSPPAQNPSDRPVETTPAK